MELTVQSIYEEYKELVSGRKYWLIFLIMSPVFIGIGALGGNPAAGIFMLVAMAIFMIGSTFSTNRALRKLKKGEFSICFDVVVRKEHYVNYRKSMSRWYVTSQKLYKRKKNVIPYYYNKIEENNPFAAIYVGRKLIMFYDLTTNSLNPELYDKVIEKI